MDNFLLCVNGIVPIFLLIGLGILLRSLGLLDDKFNDSAVKLVFKLVLPVMIFHDIATSNIGNSFDMRILALAMLTTLAMFFVVWILTVGATKDGRKRAAFSQGAFRANYAILGLPLTKALFGTEAAANATVILAVSMVLFNALAVVYLESFLNKDGNMKSTLLGIVKNPVIIGTVCGIFVYACNITLPTVAEKTINYISQMCIPLSLITIGASMRYAKMRETMGLAIWGSVIKTVITPLIFVVVTLLLGIRGENLGMLYVYWASPAAVAGYAMTRSMGGDHDLAGNIIMISTFLSFFTIFFGVLLLKNIGLA